MAATTVLVASPDEGTRAQVRLTLGDDRFTVVEADDTDGAIARIAAHVPDLVVLDVRLPGAGALAVARTLRSQPETAGVRVLLLVPRGAEPPEGEGVDETIAMPTTSFALLRKLDALLDAR